MSGERIVRANGVELCVETFGDAADPAVLLVHGASASMLWWEQELCERIAARGRHVVRFDNRDTGRSASWPPGRPGYSLRDMTDDAIGVLDALGIERAHVAGRSMAGAIAAGAALRHRERVTALTLVSTSPGGPGLPPMSPEFVSFTGSGGPDPGDAAAVVDYVTGLMRVFSGPSPYFDEQAMRALAVRDVARAASIASCLANHFLIELDEDARLEAIDVPTCVVHGERDPVFPLPHAHALRERIPGAELLVLPRAGHELPAPFWDTFADTVAGRPPLAVGAPAG
nr:alpha/beta hydrolase [Conexibacter woesei]